MKGRVFLAGRKVVTLLMELKSQMQMLANHQQQILAQLSKNTNTSSSKPTPKLPNGVVLSLIRMDQLTGLERKLTRSPEDKQMLVKTTNVPEMHINVYRKCIHFCVRIVH